MDNNIHPHHNTRYTEASRKAKKVKTYVMNDYVIPIRNVKAIADNFNPRKMQSQQVAYYKDKNSLKKQLRASVMKRDQSIEQSVDVKSWKSFFTRQDEHHS